MFRDRCKSQDSVQGLGRGAWVEGYERDDSGGDERASSAKVKHSCMSTE